MKAAIIVALLCVNAALVMMLAGTPNAPVANAQVVGGASDYVMITAKVQSDNDAVYVIDLATRRLKVWKFDKNSNRLQTVGVVDLKRDFGRKE